MGAKKLWQSKATWKDGSISTDEHYSKAEASGVCNLLLDEGNDLGKPVSAEVVYLGDKEPITASSICNVCEELAINCRCGLYRFK